MTAGVTATGGFTGLMMSDQTCGIPDDCICGRCEKIKMSDLAKYINDLAGDYVENWVGEQLAAEWQKDRDEIERLTADVKFWRSNCEEHAAVRAQQTEDLAKLTAVVEAARNVTKEGDFPKSVTWHEYIYKLRAALEKYDKQEPPE